MASILELFGDKGPKTSQINKKGDKTPISVDGGLDLSSEANLKKARGGQLNSKLYSDTVVNK